ncbi:hypothetical protein AB0B31_10875 [Catellatospora citrea]|uniref:hypothetical protein n=1 Tax=Catellatospora citrea TaxID=53366 RepID=UPI00340DEAE9
MDQFKTLAKSTLAVPSFAPYAPTVCGACRVRAPARDVKGARVRCALDSYEYAHVNALPSARTLWTCAIDVKRTADGRMGHFPYAFGQQRFTKIVSLVLGPVLLGAAMPAAA